MGESPITALIMTWEVPRGQAAVERIARLAKTALGLNEEDARQLAVQATQAPNPGSGPVHNHPVLLAVKLDVLVVWAFR